MDLDFLKVALGQPTVATEERSDGAAGDEIELTFYARLADPEALPTTPLREMQEQWTIKIAHTDENGARGDIRVRKTDIYDNGDLGKTEYVLTTKVRVDGQTAHEIPIVSSADQFEHFKTLAESGMHKLRHTYPINGTDLKWEVDVFVNPKGGFFPWVKIDLEVPSKDTPVPEFPFEAEEWIKGQNGERAPAEEAQVRELYETMFLTKNPQAVSRAEPDMDATDEQDDSAPGDVPATEVIQEFSAGVEQLVADFGVRLVKLSEGRGYLKPDELLALLTNQSPELVPLDQGGVEGSNYYYVKNPSPGALMMGVGFHMNHPTLSSDQVQF